MSLSLARTDTAIAVAAPTLPEILGVMDADAAVYARNGDVHRAQSLRDRASEIRTAAADFLTWLSVDEAALRSGESHHAMRRLAAAHLAGGHARVVGRSYQLRACVVPRRVAL